MYYGQNKVLKGKGSLFNTDSTMKNHLGLGTGSQSEILFYYKLNGDDNFLGFGFNYMR